MRIRLFLLLVPVIVLITALTIIIFKINEDRLISSIKTQELERLDIVVDDIVQEFKHIKSILAYFAEQPVVEQMLLMEEPFDEIKLSDEFESRFSSFIEHRPEFTGLTLIDNSGGALWCLEQFGDRVILTDVVREYTGSNAFRDGLKIDSNHEVFATMIKIEPSKDDLVQTTHPSIDFFKVITGPNGERVGLLRLTYNASPIITKLEQMETRAGDKILLRNVEGTVIKAGKDAYSALGNALWEKIQNHTSRTFQSDNKLYTKAIVCDQNQCGKGLNISPAARLGINSNGMPWTLVSERDIEQVITSTKASERWYLVYGMIAVLGAIALLSGFAGWRLITAYASLARAKKEAVGKDKLFSTFIDSNPSLIYAKDRKGKYVIANTSYAEFLNESPEKLIGKSDFDLENVSLEKISQLLTEEQLVLHSGEVTVKDEIWQNRESENTSVVVTRFPTDIDDDNETDMVGVIAIDVTERDMARSEMTQKDAMFKTLVDASPNAIIIINKDGTINFANKETTSIFGWDPHELIGKQVKDLIPDIAINPHLARREHDAKSHRNGLQVADRHVKALTKPGEELDVEITLSPIKINNSQMTMAIVRDVTGKLKMESQLRQSQKMEAIGHLTGGVAHDFNNLLGVIIGNLDLLSTLYPDDDKAQKRINGALKASLSGAELTKKLLAFARKQTLNPEVVDIGSILEEMMPILDRTLKGEVELKVDIASNLSQVFIDVSEFENVILNMAINARDAMAGGGIFNIEAHDVEIDAVYADTHDESLSPGQYVLIMLSDTGTGMPEEVIKHIFEPFYTTKEKGKGTGLGLAMAHGFVKQSKGLMQVYSEQGLGTTFHIYLPVVRQKGEEKKEDKTVNLEKFQGKGETILIVDDEADLADIASAYLEGMGYKTLTVHSGEEALALLTEHSGIQLVLTDIVMPGGMDGIELHKHIHETFPDIKVVYASGFSADALANKRGHDIGADLIQKPYRKQNLALVIRKNLDANP